MSERIYGVATKAWQIVAGCDDRMPCAAKCWAKNTVHRLGCSPNEKVRRFHEGLTVSLDPEMKQFAWTGEVRLNEAHLTDPLRWRKPAVIATAYHGDLFRLPDEEIGRVIQIIDNCPQHQFLLLTKCAAEMALFFSCEREYGDAWPKNLWPGFSASNQSEFDARWPHMARLAAQGWKVWVSLEPLTGAIDISRHLHCPRCGYTAHDAAIQGDHSLCGLPHPARLSQVVLGGESGPNARDAAIEDYRSIVQQCRAAGVPVLVKQITRGGKRLPMEQWPDDLRVQELAWEVRIA